MGLSIGEVFIELGFDVDDAKLKAFDEQIKSAKNGLFKISAAAAGAVFAIGSFISGPINRASVFKQFNEQLGFSAKGMQEWAIAASTFNNNLSFDQAISKYKAFGDYLKKADIGGGMFLSGLGLKYESGKDPEEYLKELSEISQATEGGGGWAKMYGEGWRARVLPLLSNIGIGPEFLSTLMKTESERASATQGRVMDEGMIEKLDRINTKVREIRRNWEMFAQNMTEKYGDKIIEFLQAFEDSVEAIVPKIAAVVEKLGGWVTVLETLMGLWVAAKTIGLLAAVSAISPAIAATVAVGAGVGAAAYGANEAGLFDFKKDRMLPDWFYTKGGTLSGEPAKIEQTNNTTITVHASGSPQENAEEIRRAFEDQEMRNNQTLYGQIDGGARK